MRAPARPRDNRFEFCSKFVRRRAFETVLIYGRVKFSEAIGHKNKPIAFIEVRFVR